MGWEPGAESQNHILACRKTLSGVSVGEVSRGVEVRDSRFTGMEAAWVFLLHVVEAGVVGDVFGRYLGLVCQVPYTPC